jgi:hypothetical protein
MGYYKFAVRRAATPMLQVVFLYDLLLKPLLKKNTALKKRCFSFNLSYEILFIMK